MFYLTVFFSGFLLVSDGRILQTVRKNQYIALYAAIALTLIIWGMESEVLNPPGKEAIILAGYALCCWCWLVAIIGIGSRLLNFSNRLLKYASDAVLPVYILHQTIIVTLGFYIIQWDTGVAPKYFFVVFAALAVSLAVYELARRTNVTRFLFGMKSRKRTAAVPAAISNMAPDLKP
jgi:glucans biosynthesis protein C